MAFTLHPQLEKDCIFVCELSQCKVLLLNNSQFPWLVLVPMHEGLRELHDLNPQDYQQVMLEIHHVSIKFSQYSQAHKMNIAALGNMVPQLHIHIISRFESDVAWPGPVWNHPAPPTPYSKAAQAQMQHELRSLLT